MRINRTLTTTTALAFLASPAIAELTAAEVWSDWQELMANYGAEISSTGESSSGGSLTISGVTTGFEVPDGSVSLVIGDITFEEQGGGAVAIRMEDTMPISIDITTPDGDDGNVGFTLLQPGASLIASGDASSLRYDFDYPTFGMGEFSIEGPEVPENLPIVIDLAMNGMKGFITLAEGDVRTYESESSIASLAMDISFADPEGAGQGSFKLSMADLAQTAVGAIGNIEMNMSAAEMIMAGMRQTGTATHGGGSYEVAFDGPDGSLQMLATATSGSLNGAFDENGVSYGGTTNGVALSFSGSMIPFPTINLKMAESGGQFTMPLVPGDKVQDFALVMRMVGLEIDDMIWSMFDPAEQLPRDPATLIIDLAGKGVLTEDITNPEYAENMNAAPPGTLEEISVNALQLTLAGAELTGDGAFTFDNSNAIPMPAGVANLMLVGGNGLLDTLVGMGFVPDEQAMGARMMMGLFARPGDGEDTLVSTIEVTEDGSVLANGQRIK